MEHKHFMFTQRHAAKSSEQTGELQTYLSRDTAQLIHRIRQACETIARSQDQSSNSEWQNTAHLDFGNAFPTLAIRHDILAKWSRLVEQDTVLLSVDQKGVHLRCGYAFVDLCHIDQGTNPPIFPIPVHVNGNGLEVSIDPEPIFILAKECAGKIKIEKLVAKQTKAEHKAKIEREQYEKALATLAPENVAKELERTKQLRKLKQWTRRLKKIMGDPPTAAKILTLPDCQGFDPEFKSMYDTQWQHYIECDHKLRQFKPRSFRSKGAEKHGKNLALATRGLNSVLFQALQASVPKGFDVYPFNAYMEVEGDMRVSLAKRIVQEYKVTLNLSPNSKTPSRV